MATRFRRLRSRRMKRRGGLRTRKQRGGLTLFGKEISLPFGKKNTPVSSVAAPAPSTTKNFTVVNPMAKNLNQRKANTTMNKIQAEMNRYKQQTNRSGSTASDPGSV